MTENTTRQTDEMTNRASTRTGATNRAMKNVDHTHPDTDRPFGEAVVYQRGPTVAADGGGRDVRATEEETDGEADDETDREKMKDVDHEPPNDDEPNRVFERGREGHDEDR